MRRTHGGALYARRVDRGPSIDLELLAEHIERPIGRGHAPTGAVAGIAGGAACGDLIRIAIVVEGDRVVDLGFEAEGCGALIAAGSAAVTLARGATLLDAARIGTREIAAALGGLSPGKQHAADLAADALARALGGAGAQDGALPASDDRLLVALSGGVDSAVAALLLARSGRDVVAVTLELWADAENDVQRSCCSAQAVREARALAHGLGWPHFTLDARERFRVGVVDPFIAEHRSGLTPNPCIRCNGEVRLDVMLALAERLGAARLATGHYARLTQPSASRGADAAAPRLRAASDDAGPLLRVAADAAKDQSYMLAALAPAMLARLCFPLGELDKATVRGLASEAGLAVAARPESQDLCFLAGTDRSRFLERHGDLRARRGEIVDSRGRLLGHHDGQHLFTVGQRRGLGVGGGEPLYVLAKEAAGNRVIVGARAQLACRALVLRGATLHRDGARVDRVRLRYHARPLACRIAGAAAAGRHGRLELDLLEPADGPAPGQTACLLDGDVVVGWGTIAAR